MNARSTFANFSAAPDRVEASQRRGSRDEQVTLFVVRDVEHEPRRSFEIADIRAFAADALPDDLTPATRRRADEWRGEAAIAPEW